MVVGTDELEAIKESIKVFSDKLREMNPNHSLLRYAKPVLDSTEWDEVLVHEYLQRFAPKPHTQSSHALQNYLMALKKELGLSANETLTGSQA